MKDKKDQIIFLAGVGIFLLLITVPYLYAWQAVGEEAVFGGFLPNPTDGNSYLAKMRLGFEGSWTFVLPYSADPGDPTALNLFYLFLGHISRILGLPLILVYHGARLLGAVLLSLTLWRLVKRFFKNSLDGVLAWLFLQFGLGSGWLVVIFFPQFLSEGLSTDLWVAEAYPFLSGFTNAHFPFGLTLLLVLINDFAFSDYQFGIKNNTLVLFKSLLLSVIMPFGLPILGVVISLVYIQRLMAREIGWKRIRDALPLLLGGGPMAVYYAVVSNSHPVISIWNAQNQTTTPHPIDLLFSFSPVLIFAFLGIWFVLKNKNKRLYPLVFWLTAGIIILYIPVSFQRRFISGFYFPVVVLGIFGLRSLFASRQKIFRLTWFALFTTSLISTTLIFASGFKVVQTAEPLLYLSRDEADILNEMAKIGMDNDLVLTTTRMGNFIPAYADARVLYGHPFETVNAKEMAGKVNTFFLGYMSESDQQKLLLDYDIDYLLIDPLDYPGEDAVWVDWIPMLESGSLQLFKVQQ